MCVRVVVFLRETSSGLFYMEPKEVNIIKSVCVCVCVRVVVFGGGTSSGLFYMKQKEVNVIKSVCVCARIVVFGGKPLLVCFA